MVCTFFGHRYFDETYIPKLKETIEDLIINRVKNIKFGPTLLPHKARERESRKNKIKRL